MWRVIVFRWALCALLLKQTRAEVTPSTCFHSSHTVLDLPQTLFSKWRFPRRQSPTATERSAVLGSHPPLYIVTLKLFMLPKLTDLPEQDPGTNRLLWQTPLPLK